MGRGMLDGVSEGEWSVFAQKVVEERDEARAQRDALAEALKKLHPDRDDDSGSEHECCECGDSYWLRDGDDPTPECDRCAQKILREVRIAARAALAKVEEKKP